MSEASQKIETPLLTLTDVCKTYLDGNVRALQDVSFQMPVGDFTTIMGPSGCGKSTLLHMLGALDRPTSGEIRFRGEVLDQRKNLDQLRAREFGFVFQSFYLLPNLTSLENVQLPMFEGDRPAAQRQDEARKLLGLVGLETRIDHLPNQLSIGQRQRVAIARAMANGPSVIFADEPTGSLDSESGNEVMDLLGQLNRDSGTTLVVVTHDERVARRGKRLIRMLDGRIIEDSVTTSSSLS